MLDSILDAIVVLLPLAIAVMSVLVGIRLAKNPSDQSHKRWWRSIMVLGLICSGVTLWQQQRSRRAHAIEVDGQQETLKKLQTKLDEAEIRRAGETKYLEGQLSVLSQFGPGVLKLAETSAVRCVGQESDVKPPRLPSTLDERVAGGDFRKLPRGAQEYSHVEVQIAPDPLLDRTGQLG